MSYKPISNFSIPDSSFKYNDVAETKWLNTTGVVDLQMKMDSDTFSGYGTLQQQQVDLAWSDLCERAKANLPDGSVFTFYNSEILKWNGMAEQGNAVRVSKGLFYQAVTAVRSQQELFDSIEVKPSAFVLMNIVVTADNKIVLGRRGYYGDWPNDTYECAGSFLKESDIEIDSLTEIAKQKIHDDYVSAGEIISAPFIIFELPRVMETMLICVSKTNLTAAQMRSVFYTDVLAIDNSAAGKDQLQAMDVKLFHPPSRVVLEVYFDKFSMAQDLLQKAV